MIKKNEILLKDKYILGEFCNKAQIHLSNTTVKASQYQ